MGLVQRLKKLESAIGRRQPLRVEAPERELSDEEEADIIGADLWEQARNPQVQGNWGAGSFSNPEFAGVMRSWHEAAQLARQDHHTEYHVGLRPFAMSIWLHFKANILKHPATYGKWIWDEPPTRGDTMSLAEFNALDAENKMGIRQAMNKRRGHWSKDPHHKR